MSKAERSLQQSISEQALVTQKRRTDRLKQEQKGVQGHGRPSSPSAAQEPSSSAPATPTKSSTSSKEKKIRVTTSDGRQAMLTLQAQTTFSELQRSIANEFIVSPAQQCIRHGFPPKELFPPKDGEENEPVALQHGDRVTVEILRGPEDHKVSAPSASSSHSNLHSLHSVKSDDPVTSSRMNTSRELQENIDLEMSSLCLLATLMGKQGEGWENSFLLKSLGIFIFTLYHYLLLKKDNLATRHLPV